MRIHNTVSTPVKTRRWPVPAAIAVLLLLTGANLFSTGESSARAVSLGHKQNFKRVQVAKFMIPAGKIIEAADLASEDRPESAVPEGTFSTSEELIGRAAASPIPARAPIAAVWLVDDSAADDLALGALLKTPQPNEVPQSVPQPAKEDKSVSIFLKVRGEMPAVGSRVAIGIEGKKGKSAVVLADSFVKSVSGRQIQLGVAPEQRDYLKAAQLLGKVRLISIGDSTEESPFAGIVVTDLGQLKSRLAITDEVAKAEQKSKHAHSQSHSQ